jgi:DNA-binding IscR family transcriptional regulator
MAGLREAGLVQSEKGHGGGWRLSRALQEITLLAVYQALGSPNLFSIGNRSRDSDCLVEKKVKTVMEDTMAEATALFARRFAEITLDQIAPSDRASIQMHTER